MAREFEQENEMKILSVFFEMFYWQVQVDFFLRNVLLLIKQFLRSCEVSFTHSGAKQLSFLNP
jgi:hypothetical protein